LKEALSSSHSARGAHMQRHAARTRCLRGATWLNAPGKRQSAGLRPNRAPRSSSARPSPGAGAAARDSARPGAGSTCAPSSPVSRTCARTRPSSTRSSARALRCTTRAAASPTSWLPQAARHAPPRARARAAGAAAARWPWQRGVRGEHAVSGRRGTGRWGRGAAGEGMTGPLQV